MDVTDEDIVRLARSCSGISSHFLSPSNYETLIGYIRDRSNSATPSESVFEYASSLLSVVSKCSSSSELSPLVSGVILCYTELFTSRKIPHDRNSLSAVSLLAMYISAVSDDDLVALTDLIVGDLPRVTNEEDAQLMDLLPQCLYLVYNSKVIDKCKEYVDSVIDKILVMEWSKVLLVKMVSIVKEFSILDKARHREFLDKVFQGMGAVDLQDLPSLVYQLLVLASKGFSKKEVIERILMHFGTILRKKPNSVSRQVEGTILLHVNFAVKQDPSTGQEIIGLVKSDVGVVNHFSVAVMLSVARVRRFTASSLSTLKNAVLTVYRDYNISKKCKWLPDDLKKEFFRRLKLVEKAMLVAVNESRYGREHITPSIVMLCFTLLETVDEGFQKTADGVIGLEELCIQMLKTVFEVHDMARNEVIDQCKFRVLSLKPEQSMPILRLLGFLVKNYCHQLIEHCSRVKDLLDYFTCMHVDVASNLINTLLPLIKISRELQDYIILVVRKALFRREDSIRLAATNAILDLILADKASTKDVLYSFQESSSQASCSQQDKMPCGTTRANLFQDLSGLLQRCLYQQARVKEILYYGLVKLVSVDPSIAGSIFDFLLPHFLQYHNEHSANGQLDLSRCVKLESGKAFIQESLDQLLSCISWVLLLQPHENPGCPLASPWAAIGFSLSEENEVARSFCNEMFSTAMVKIRREIRNGHYEGFLSSTLAASSKTPDAEKSRCIASIVSGIIDVFVNNIAAELEKSTDAEQEELIKELVDLINMRNSLERALSISTMENGVKKGNTQSNTDHISDDKDLGHDKLSERKILFATKSIRQLMVTTLKLYESAHNISSQNQSQASFVNNSVDCAGLISYALHACVRHVEAFRTVSAEDPNRTLLCGDIRILGAPLLTLVMLLISGNKFDSEEHNNKCKGNKVSGDMREQVHLALKCLKELIMISTSNIDQISMLEDMTKVPKRDYTDIMDSGWEDECRKASEITNEPLRIKEMFMARVLKPLITMLLASAYFHEVEIVCEIMMLIEKEMPSEQRRLHGAWSVRMLGTKSIKNPKVVKALVSLAIFLNLPPDDLVLAQELAVELSNVIGFHDQSPRQISEVFPIINHLTSKFVAASMLNVIELVVADIDWATMKLKLFYSAGQKRTYTHEYESLAPVSLLEETLYSRTEAVVRVLSSFVVMNLNDIQAEQLLRLAGKFYKQLARMSKLCIAPRGSKQQIPSPKFQNLVDATCKHLTVPVYNFVDVMQKRQQESTAKKLINKIKRENRCIPDLIFQIEDYEKYLIQLSKVSKINFLRFAKRSIARDFKIKFQKEAEAEETVPNHGSPDHQSSAALNEMSNSHEDGVYQDRVPSPETMSPMVVEDSDADNEETPPSAKRVRKHGVGQDSVESFR